MDDLTMEAIESLAEKMTAKDTPEDNVTPVQVKFTWNKSAFNYAIDGRARLHWVSTFAPTIVSFDVCHHLVWIVSLKSVVQWSLLNSHNKCAEKSCELSKHANYPSLFYVPCELSKSILCSVSINSSKLCPQQAYELNGVCELARVKLSGLYCTHLLVDAIAGTDKTADTQCERALKTIVLENVKQLCICYYRFVGGTKHLTSQLDESIVSN